MAPRFLSVVAISGLVLALLVVQCSSQAGETASKWLRLMRADLQQASAPTTVSTVGGPYRQRLLRHKCPALPCPADPLAACTAYTKAPANIANLDACTTAFSSSNTCPADCKAFWGGLLAIPACASYASVVIATSPEDQVVAAFTSWLTNSCGIDIPPSPSPSASPSPSPSASPSPTPTPAPSAPPPPKSAAHAANAVGLWVRWQTVGEGGRPMYVWGDDCRAHLPAAVRPANERIRPCVHADAPAGGCGGVGGGDGVKTELRCCSQISRS